jgi:hypothetical protein
VFRVSRTNQAVRVRRLGLKMRPSVARERPGSGAAWENLRTSMAVFSASLVAVLSVSRSCSPSWQLTARGVRDDILLAARKRGIQLSVYEQAA